jgi:arginine decarboxylase-like protein
MKIKTRRTLEPVGLAGYLWEAYTEVSGEEYNEFGDTKAEAINELKYTIEGEKNEED